MAIGAGAWYNPSLAIPGIFQGDILQGVPVVFMPPATHRPWTILKAGPPVTREQALAGNLPKAFYPRRDPNPEIWSDDQELVLAKGIRSKIMVVTQSCDIDHRNYLQVVPVYAAGDLNPQKREALRALDVLYMFYLPATGLDFPESFADLSQISSVHKSYIRGARALLRLSAVATTALQNHLAEYYSRPFGFNTRDIVPVAGNYSCVNCFYTYQRISTSVQRQGDLFKACDACGQDALWLMLP